MSLVKLYNGPMPTTAVLAKVATGTAIKTMMQLKGTMKLRVVEWGVSFDGSAAAVPIQVELIETGTVFATVTAYVEADAHKYGDPDAEAATVQLGLSYGTEASGFTGSVEGSIVASRLLDHQQIAPTNQFVFQFPLGREAVYNHAQALRIRVKAAVDVNMSCYLLIDKY